MFGDGKLYASLSLIFKFTASSMLVKPVLLFYDYKCQQTKGYVPENTVAEQEKVEVASENSAAAK